MNIHTSKPWIEKYRPTNFEDIILEEDNRKILNRMIETDILNNILFYGPPGTGKTTTILNLIHKYRVKYNEKGDDLTIHLNASDERGIDIIRNQIYTFVNSKSLFNKGKKFIILDEVDYMTKTAQQALKTIINKFDDNICFCLICNYVSRIEKTLQDIFIHFRFNSLPEKQINEYLNSVVKSEKLNINTKKLNKIVRFFNSDIRSMINYLQINQHNLYSIYLLDDIEYKKILESLHNKTPKQVYSKITNISLKHNISLKEILKRLCYSIQENYCKQYPEIIKTITYVLHDKTNELKYLIYFLLSSIKISFRSSSSK